MEHLFALVIAVLAAIFGIQAAFGLLFSLVILGIFAFNVDGGKLFSAPIALLVFLVEGGIVCTAWYVFNECLPYLS